MGRVWPVISKLETIKNELSNHRSVDGTLKYFQIGKCYVLFFGRSYVTCES